MTNTIVKALIRPLTSPNGVALGASASEANQLVVQFNPDSLKLTFANSMQVGQGGQPAQYVSAATSKLDLTLVFDTTTDGADVRNETRKLVLFMNPAVVVQTLPAAAAPAGSPAPTTPPASTSSSPLSSSNPMMSSMDDGGVCICPPAAPPPTPPAPPRTVRRLVPSRIRFIWGTFVFTGYIETLQETLDYFSPEGVPLRSTVAISISQQQRLDDQRTDEAADRVRAATNNRIDDTQLAIDGDAPLEDAAGTPAAARSLGAANGVANLRQPKLGTLTSFDGGGVRIGAAAAFSAGASAGIAAGGSATAALAVSAGAGASTGAGPGAMARAGASFGAGAVAGFGVAVGAAAGIGFGAAGVSASVAARSSGATSAAVTAVYAAAGATSLAAFAGLSTPPALPQPIAARGPDAPPPGGLSATASFRASVEPRGKIEFS